MPNIFGGVETGGTKCICIAAISPDQILDETTFPTVSPQETTNSIVAFFQRFEKETRQKVNAIGLASFGPIDLNPGSNSFGKILSTPKPEWSGWDMLGEFQNLVGVPVFLDTDVNGASLGEYLWGAAKRLENFIYMTIGTGIGGGAMLNSQLLHGLIHPEMGHILIPHDIQIDPFEGICPFHRDCFEGLASGPAIEKRWGKPSLNLPDDHPAWDLEAHYISLGLHNLICSLSPERVILGGGVMQRTNLFRKIRANVRKSLAGYVPARQILEEIDQFIVPPVLGRRAGVLGALGLAMLKSEAFTATGLE